MNTLFDNEKLFGEIDKKIQQIKQFREDSLFEKDFSLRFCWSSNAIEGNTLSLDETVSLIEFDEVQAGHTYSEYQETKNLYRAIEKMLLPFRKREITENWIKESNALVLGGDGAYRTNPLYIGSVVEAVYYPPAPEKVPELMGEFSKRLNFKEEDTKKILCEVARQHIQFEQIHPFSDGNGRVGRMILNQQIINHDLIPLVIEPGSKYRQAFLRCEKKGDLSMMVHVLCKSELESMERLEIILRGKQEALKKNWTPGL